jgi:hypothetical protein
LAKYTIEGMKELEKTIRKLGQLPQTVVTKAAKEGIKIAHKAAKLGKWKDRTGNLRRGLVIKGEKSRIKGKKVYQVTLNKKMNSIFQKTTSTGMTRDNKTKKARKGVYYYPASIEYGFRHVNSGRNIPGVHYLRDGLVENKTAFEKKVVTTMQKEIDKVL